MLHVFKCFGELVESVRLKKCDRSLVFLRNGFVGPLIEMFAREDLPKQEGLQWVNGKLVEGLGFPFIEWLVYSPSIDVAPSPAALMELLDKGLEIPDSIFLTGGEAAVES